ncbi:hypothetical protein DWG20_14445 [Crenobacter cavernae]|uniref:Transposase DDE domain-containing protein n=1 Tax=Crenobacter cavernae TaxID=2290923 RepID=A0A345Y9D1_9NEIS|nr:hypothetical protein DWG20_14445 [Crenobacter cavernae]
MLIWLDKDMAWQGEPSGPRGRPPKFSDAATPFCPTIKGLFGLALRQTVGMVESLLKLAGLDWTVPELQHALSSPAVSDGSNPCSPDPFGAAPTDRQYRHQNAGRGRVGCVRIFNSLRDNEKVRRGVASPMAQRSSGH